MASKKPKTHLRWRDAGTGQFLTDRQAEQKPKDTVVHERVPTRGKRKK